MARPLHHHPRHVSEPFPFVHGERVRDGGDDVKGNRGEILQ